MKALVIGGSSLLGKYLETTKEKREVESTWFTNFQSGSLHLDICSFSQVAYVFSRIQPEVVIHCSAIGSVDYAESHYSNTHMVNVIGTRNVCMACRQFKSRLVYISSNAVFNGKYPPYDETADRLPINSYGRIKKEAEDTVTEADIPWIIIRPFLLYGWPYLNARQNWFTTILSKLGLHQEIKLVDDTYWQPTLARDCAAAIWKLIELNQWNETYHVASDDRVTLYEFGLKIVEEFGGDKQLIQAISSDELKIAPRPKDTTFNLSKIHNLGIQLKGIAEGLKYLHGTG